MSKQESVSLFMYTSTSETYVIILVCMRVCICMRVSVLLGGNRWWYLCMLAFLQTFH
jgi:hypothetical protein